jgi:putative DNA methylase
VKKKLIEVALPLDKINAASAKEKNIRFGHPSTLHLWWARRPLAACRAVLFASLVDDPSSRPDLFPTEEAQQLERDRLFAILEQLVQWDKSSDADVLRAAEAEISASADGDMPTIYDPFCGGGSIPLEAQRLGLASRGSDINPVPVLITKAMIEIPARYANQKPINPPSQSTRDLSQWLGAKGLAEDVKYYGSLLRKKAWERIGHLYPPARLPRELGGGEVPVIAWLWARTTKCPNPACGATMPLVRSFVLSSKIGKKAWVEPVIDRNTKQVSFSVAAGAGAPPPGTVDRRGARCLVCEEAVKLDYIRAEGKARRLGCRLMAMVVEINGQRTYLKPDPEHASVAESARPAWEPDTELPEKALGFRVQGYGMTKHSDLFTKRQLVALTTYSDLVKEARQESIKDGASPDYADAISTYLALGVSRLSDILNGLCRWENTKTQVRNLFGRQAVPMVWDFGENNVFNGCAGDYEVSLGNLVRALEALPAKGGGSAAQRDAAVLDVNGSFLFCTDPPYYDNIGYADLSDFFYVWLRKTLRNIYPDLLQTVLVPKAQELIADPSRFNGNQTKARDFFEEGFGKAFGRMRLLQHPEYPLAVFYAFKQAEDEDEDESRAVASTGWETMLEGLLRAGFQITGTWPMRSELGNRPRAQESNALASSIVLVCRLRRETASVTTEMDFQQSLRAELPKSLRTMQQESIAPVDLAQAAIGPGMSIYSRYARVLGPEGKPVPVRKALEMINRVLDEVLSEQEGEFDSDTRFALAWFQQFGMRSGTFGTADVLSRAMNIGVTGMENAGILEARAGTVRLLKWEELPEDWDPDKDRRLTVWEMTHHLIRLMYKESDAAAARLLSKLGDDAEKARDLAYRLYQICERSKWSQEAQPYNALVVAWPNLTSEARQLEKKTSPEQLTL